MIGAVVVGALAAADRTAFGQTFLAHPVVVGSLSAALAGHPADGARAAVVLALASIARVPVGEQHVRDWTTAAVVVPWWIGPQPEPARWGAALLLSLIVVLAGGRTIEALRGLNARAIERWRRTPGAGRARAAAGLHLGLASLHLLRGALGVAVAVPIGTAILDTVLGRLPAAEVRALEWFWVLAPFGLLPLLWRFQSGLAPGRGRWVAFGVGLLGTALILGTTGVPR